MKHTSMKHTKESLSANKRQTGAFYECKAEQYLREKGYRILETNFQNRSGEIDIIAPRDKVCSYIH